MIIDNYSVLPDQLPKNALYIFAEVPDYDLGPVEDIENLDGIPRRLVYDVYGVIIRDSLNQCYKDLEHIKNEYQNQNYHTIDSDDIANGHDYDDDYNQINVDLGVEITLH